MIHALPPKSKRGGPRTEEAGMIFHIAVCSPDAGLRSGLERQCMEYFARRADACIVQQLPEIN